MADLNSRMGQALRNEDSHLKRLLGKAEQASGVQREYLAYGLVSLLCLYLMACSGAAFVCNSLLVLPAAYGTFLAMKTPSKEDDFQAMMFWVLFGVHTLFDSWADALYDCYFPFYWVFKLFGLAYAWYENGARIVWEKAVSPAFEKYQASCGGGFGGGGGGPPPPDAPPMDGPPPDGPPPDLQ